MSDLSEPPRDKSEYWQERISAAKGAFKSWNDVADRVDDMYSGKRTGVVADREFNLFWSNMEVIRPAIYARVPRPAVAPRFADRDPVRSTAAEMLERVAISALDMVRFEDVMLALRDDLLLPGRGVGRVRRDPDSPCRVAVDHFPRADFVHDPGARAWREVQWAAFQHWFTREEAEERWPSRADDLATANRSRGTTGLSYERTDLIPVWEIWDREAKKVHWLAACESAGVFLESGEPDVDVAGFFPCPRPVYATLERGKLIPVPDATFYADQLEEINDLTRRIHTLSDALRLRGFYAGGGDVAAAIETAVALRDDEQVLVPVPNLASLTAGSGGEIITWMPLDMVATTITGLVTLRRQVIEDVYQITGLSDILRGETEASETLGAQKMKQQNGSGRVRGKQRDLERWARDAVQIMLEVMIGELDGSDMLELSLMDLPTDAETRAEVRRLTAQGREIAASAQNAPPAPDGADPMAQVQEQLMQLSGQIDQVSARVTIDKVMKLIRDDTLRAYAVDIETDSTVFADEAAEKESRAEFVAVFANVAQSLAPLATMGPQAARMAGGVLKFALAPYRVGRELESMIDDFADSAAQQAAAMQDQQGQGADMKLAEAEQAKADASAMQVQARAAQAQADLQLKTAQARMDAREAEAKLAAAQQAFQLEVAEAQERLRAEAAEVQRKRDETDAKIADMQVRQAQDWARIETAQRAQSVSEARAAIAAAAPAQGATNDE